MALFCFVKTDHNEKDKNKQKKSETKEVSQSHTNFFFYYPDLTHSKKKKNGQL